MPLLCHFVAVKISLGGIAARAIWVNGNNAPGHSSKSELNFFGLGGTDYISRSGRSILACSRGLRPSGRGCFWDKVARMEIGLGF